MIYRALIFDDDRIVRRLLWHYFDKREYEVFTFPHPKACPLIDTASCTCPLNTSCADIILTDLEMPYIKGLAFLKHQIHKGCKVNNLALMSGNLDESSYHQATTNGIKIFHKPFSINEIDAWVKEREAAIDLHRRLIDFHEIV